MILIRKLFKRKGRFTFEELYQTNRGKHTLIVRVCDEQGRPYRELIIPEQSIMREYYKEIMPFEVISILKHGANTMLITIKGESHA